MARILVIDDEKLIADLVRMLLSRHGHEVTVAYSGSEGLTQFSKLHPDVVILDYRMPGMDGLEVLKELRGMDQGVPVVLLSSWIDDLQENQARQLGSFDILGKGLSMEVILSAIRRAVEHAAPPQKPALSDDGTIQANAEESPTGAKILVVDDEHIICNLVQRFLSQRGYRVRVAYDAGMAWAMVARDAPDLIVLDMYMPGTDGATLLAGLRQNGYKGGCVVLSASQDEQLLLNAMKVGAVEVLAKPLDLAKLETAVMVGLVCEGS